MKILILLTVFIVLFKEIEPSALRRVSFNNSSDKYSSSDSDEEYDGGESSDEESSDTESSDEESSDEDFSNEATSDEEFSDEESDGETDSSENSDDDEEDSDSDDDYDTWNGCPKVTMNNCFNVNYSCNNGRFFVSGIEIKNVKSSDRVTINENKVYVNNKFIREIPSFRNNGSWYNVSSKYGCPSSIVKISCYNVSTTCINGTFYINGEAIKNLKTSDEVLIISNNLKINGKFIRYIPPSGYNNGKGIFNSYF